MSAKPATLEEAHTPMFSATTTRFRDLLPRDHARLDAMLASILELVHVDLRPELAEHWAVYEDGVLAHLDAEEMFMLPELARHDAPRANEIRTEHATIRALLAEVGVGIELHVVREDRMQELATFLRRHAEAEEREFYKWADKELPEGSLQGLVRRLRVAWDRSWASPRSASGVDGAEAPAPEASRPRSRIATRHTSGTGGRF